jgi:tetratricopeptide (TPR) repeat protein
LDTDFKIPKSLRDALIAGEVVPFVGAGVSMSVKKKNADGTESNESLFPSWKGFVEILAQALRDEQKPKEAEYALTSVNIAKPKYLDALQHAQEELGKSLWYKLFDESFDIPVSKAHQYSFELNQLIWKLSNNLIVTTNVDRVLQWTCPQPTEFRPLDVQNVEYAQLQKEQIPKRPTVWYLHGHIDHKEKVIFTREQFEAFYKQRDNHAKLQTLLNFLTQRTFLFIGFSLDDAYLREQLEDIHNIYKGSADSLYILLRERDIASANLPDYVKPIPFSDFGKPLEDLVAELARIAKSGDDDTGKDNKPNTPSDSKPDVKRPFFNVQYNSKGKEFVGRVGKMEEIWNLLNQDGCASIGQAVSVKGFGGLGKTQLAVEYAHAYKGKYKNGVFWVVADENVDNQLLQIADKCGWINQFDKTVNQLDVAKARFLALSDCLILFDNVEAFADIKDYLPKTDLQTHILITTREKQAAFRQIDLDLLERNESRELLLKISKRNPQDEIEKEHLEEILETLGDIPLAIELVGGYLAEHENVTFAKYHQYLNEVPLNELEKQFPEGSFTNHDRSIIQTLRISEKTIYEKPLMVEILKVLAWSGSSSMGTSLLKALVETEGDFEFETALGDAHKLRLLKKEEDVERYAIHRLFAKVIRHEELLETQNAWCQRIVGNLEEWFNIRKEDFNYLAQFEAEIEHLVEWQNNMVNILPERSVRLLVLESYPFWRRGSYSESSERLEKSSNLYVSKNLDNNVLLIHVKNDLGVIYGELGNHQKALEYQELALESQKCLFGEKHSDTARFYNNIGITYRNLGNYQKALEYHKVVLELHKELFGEKNSDTATSYNNIGSTYGALGNYQKALEYQKVALKLRKELFGEKHPDTATSYNNIGGTYADLGNYQKALEYKETALELLKGLFGEKHPNIANSYNNVGSTYGNLGNHQKALEYKEIALKLQKEIFGEKHPDTANSYNSVGSTYRDLGNYQKALEYQKVALELRKELLGEKHPETATSYNNVGGNYADLANYQKAFEYQEESVKIYREVLGKQHPNTINCEVYLIDTYLKSGNREKAGKSAAEIFSYVPQNHRDWSWLEEISRPYRPKKNRHKKRRN